MKVNYEKILRVIKTHKRTFFEGQRGQCTYSVPWEIEDSLAQEIFNLIEEELNNVKQRP